MYVYVVTAINKLDEQTLLDPAHKASGNRLNDREYNTAVLGRCVRGVVQKGSVDTTMN